MCASQNDAMIGHGVLCEDRLLNRQGSELSVQYSINNFTTLTVTVTNSVN